MDLEVIKNWAYQWKMEFNPDITKQATEIVFSVKKNKPSHPDLVFNGVPVSREPFTKHLGLYLDSNLNFSKHISEAIIKASKGLSLLKYLSKYVSRKVLDLSYKLYVRPHLDYGDIIYHNQRSDLMNLIEQVQYKAALIVSGCWQGTNRTKLYEELGWESLSDRRWQRRLSTFYKISNNMTPSYLRDHILPSFDRLTSTRSNSLRAPLARTDRFSNSFFPYCITNWNLLDVSLSSTPSYHIFKNSLIKFIRPKGNSFYSIRDNDGIRLLTKIRVTFSDLRDHRFNHNFNCTSPVCLCGLDDETSVHFLLCCPRYGDLRNEYLGKICTIIGSDVTILPYDHLCDILMYGSNVYNDNVNEKIIKETIYYIKQSGRFKKLEAFV